MFDSVYSIALDILGKIGGDTTKHYDSAYEIALEILDVLGGDTTKKFDSVYSILLDIYQARFGSVLTNMDSNYSILKEINKAFDPTDTTNFDSPYSVLVSIDGQPGLIGHLFEIVTDAANTVIINGVEQTSARIPEGETVTWSVSRDHYVTQSGSFVMGDSDYSISVTLVLEQFTFTINPTPADATMVINGSERSSITADYGTEVSWSVSRTGYASQSGTYNLITDHTENVSLTINQYTFSIVPTPVDATVVINGEERSSFTADYGTTINWSVSKTGYVTQSGTEVLTETYSMDIDLSLSNYTFTVEATPVDATVVINGVERTSYTAPYGTAITWSVSASHYVTQTGSYTLTGDHYETVDLVLENHTFSISTDVANTVVINGVQRTSITAPYGTSITWTVSRDHYVSQTNTFNLTADATESITLEIMKFSITVTATPNDATIYINGQERSTVTGIPYGQYTYYQVIKTGYVTQSGGFNITEDTTVNVTLVLDQFTFTINPTPADAVVTINGQVRSSLTADYGTAITWSVAKTGYVTQNGSLTLEDDTTESVTLVEESGDYFAFDVLSDGDIIWKMYNSNATPTTIEYRKNNGSWNSITSTTAGVTIPVETGDVLEFCGDNDAYCNNNSNGYNCFGVDSGATFNVRGNIMSLIDSDDFDNLTILPIVGQNFRSLFQGCTGLIDASQLELPATTLASSCYRAMFYGCTGLVAAPVLPATALVDNCYKYMFRDCAITTAPVLPATTLAESCYQYMFQGCASLTNAPVLPATTLANTCYGYMFQNCSSLNYIKCLATDISASGCTSSWVSGVAATGTFIKDPNMSSWTIGTGGIPTGWTAIDYASDTFTIDPTPADATVVINGVERSSYTGMGGDVVTWSVSKEGYVTQTGSYMLDGTAHTESVTLVAEQYTFSITPSRSTAAVIINDALRNSITADYGTVIKWQVSDYGYATQQGSFTLSQDYSMNVTLVATTDPSTEYLTFDILTDGDIKWIANNASSSLSTHTIEYNKNNGGWTSITSADSSDPNASIPVEAGDVLQFRGKNNGYGSSSTLYSGFRGTAEFNAHGNLFSMITALDPEHAYATTTYTFYRMFANSLIKDATNLLIPSMQIMNYMFSYTFNNCTNMNVGPRVSNFTGSINSGTRYAYQYMFAGCTKLVYLRCDVTAFNSSTYRPFQYWMDGVHANGIFARPTASAPGTYAYLPTSWTSIGYNLECTFTINPTPNDATVIINGVERSSYTGIGGERVYWEVSKGDYNTQSGSYVLRGTDYTNNVTLVKTYCTITIVPTPADATVMINGEERSTYTGLGGVAVTWEVSKEDYITQSGTITPTDDVTEAVTLEVDQNARYLTFDVVGDGRITWIGGTSGNKTIYYSKNGGEWTSLTASYSGTSFNVSAGDEIRFKGTNTAYGTPSGVQNRFAGGTATYNVSGNIMSLVGGDNFKTLTSLDSVGYNFKQLFTAPGPVDASKLVLPATTLAAGCYYTMFGGCTSLTKAPASLPATTLANECYQGMFSGCTSLTTAPTIAATTLANNCCSYMFNGCASLTQAPVLNAATLVTNCYSYMFSGCTSLNYVYCMATDISVTSGTSNWLNNVASTGSFYKKSSTSWATGASGIPTGWTVINI